MSELWQRKMVTVFHRTDFDSDGLISKRDFERIAERLYASEDVGSVGREKMRNLMVDLWQMCMSSAKSDENRYLTETVLINSLKKKRNDPKLRAILHDVCRYFIEAPNAKEEGFLDLEEFRRALTIFGYPDTSFAEKTFKILDTDHDGKLSVEEDAHGFVEFMLSDDKCSKYNFFFGNLN